MEPVPPNTFLHANRPTHPFMLTIAKPLTIRAERNSRVQEQHLGLKRVGEDLLGLQQKMDVERIARWVGAWCVGAD